MRSQDLKFLDESTLQSLKGKPPNRKWTDEAQPDDLFCPDKIVVTRSKISAQTNPDIVIIHQSNNYLSQLHEEETAEVLNEMDENYVEISAEQNIVLNHFDNYGLVQLKIVDVKKAPQNCPPPNVSPHFWQVLGYMDAHITETLIGSLEIKTH